jgi:hypothetical protein
VSTNRKRASRRRRATSDEQLILAFMRGEVSREDLNRARGAFFTNAMAHARTHAGSLTAELWREHGPALLAKHKEPLPHHLAFLAHWMGRP